MRSGGSEKGTSEADRVHGRPMFLAEWVIALAFTLKKKGREMGHSIFDACVLELVIRKIIVGTRD